MPFHSIHSDEAGDEKRDVCVCITMLSFEVGVFCCFKGSVSEHNREKKLRPLGTIRTKTLAVNTHGITDQLLYVDEKGKQSRVFSHSAQQPELLL